MATVAGERVTIPDLHQWVAVFGILYVTTVLGIIKGFAGVLVGAGLVVVWYLSSLIGAFVFGNITLLLLPDVVALAFPFALVEAGFGCLLVSAASRTANLWRTGAVAGGFFVLLAVSVAGGVALVEPLWAVALCLVVLVVVLAYSMHRYERFTLGLVEEA